MQGLTSERTELPPSGSLYCGYCRGYIGFGSLSGQHLCLGVCSELQQTLRGQYCGHGQQNSAGPVGRQGSAVVLVGVVVVVVAVVVVVVVSGVQVWISVSWPLQAPETGQILERIWNPAGKQADQSDQLTHSETKQSSSYYAYDHHAWFCRGVVTCAHFS